jgi:hypothetical protein
MMKIRFPKLMVVELMVNALDCLLQCLMNLNFFDAPVPCQPIEAIMDGIDCCANTMLIGRACVLFSAAVSAGQEVSSRNIFEYVIDFLAYLTAPADYFRLKLQKPQKRLQKGVSMSREQLLASMTSMELEQEAKGSTSSGGFDARLLELGFGRFVIVQFIWFGVGFFYSIFPTVTSYGSAAWNNPQIGPFICWLNYIAPSTALVYAMTAICFLFILVSVWSVQDAVGLRNDLLFSLVFGFFSKALNAGFVTFSSNMIAMNALVFTYAPAAFLGALVSLSVAAYYVGQLEKTPLISIDGERTQSLNLHDCSQESMRGSSAKLGRTVAAFRKFWESEEGKRVIVLLSRKLYVTESVNFLFDTDSLENLDSNRVDYLFKQYIQEGAVYELNISDDFKRKFRTRYKFLQDVQNSHDLTVSLQDCCKVLREIRLEVLSLLATPMQFAASDFPENLEQGLEEFYLSKLSSVPKSENSRVSFSDSKKAAI